MRKAIIIATIASIYILSCIGVYSVAKIIKAAMNPPAVQIDPPEQRIEWLEERVADLAGRVSELEERRLPGVEVPAEAIAPERIEK